MAKTVKLIVGISIVLSAVMTFAEKGSAQQVAAAQDKDALIIGLIPEQNVFRQIERYEPLVNYLAARCGRDIKLKVLVRYGNIVHNFASADMDGAFFGSFTYCLAHIKMGVEVIARPVSIAGVSSYHGLILVRKDSGIRSAREMQGKRFAFVDRATTAGYLLPLAYFKENGIDDYRRFLRETYFSGTHQDVIYDVLNKKADIGAAKNTVFERFAKIDDRILKELAILKRSPDVPENALAFRRDLAPALKDRIREALLEMHLDSEGKKVLQRFGARKFIKTTTDDYVNVFKYAQQIGLNLGTYDYLND